MREELIAYALGELDEEGCLRVEQALAADPALATEFDQIERCLAEVESSPQPPTGLPRGLADRTAEQVLACCESTDGTSGRTSGLGRCSSASAGTGARASNFSLVDMTVVCGVMLILGCLLLPALYSRRNEAQRIACRDNLRQLGMHMVAYSENHDGYFPLVRPNEHAGIYSVRLVESGIVQAGDLSGQLLCVASPLAEELAGEGKDLLVPTAAQFARARGTLLFRFRKTSGGSYAYQVGWVKDGVYLPAKNRENSQVPVLADAPNIASNRNCGANHGGCIINVLFQDGTVLSLRTCLVPCGYDNIFVNDDGEPAAGRRWPDAVALPSAATPGVDVPLSKVFENRFEF